jgi:hypothetical protein
MFRKAVPISAALGFVVALAVASPAGAITFGQPDNGVHPNVAAIVADTRGTGELRPFCSGTLISSTVVLTAGHRTDALATRGIGVHDVWVSFDDDARSSNPQRRLLRGTWMTGPGYGTGARAASPIRTSSASSSSTHRSPGGRRRRSPRPASSAPCD